VGSRAYLFLAVRTGLSDIYRTREVSRLARTLRDSKLDTREARTRLKVRSRPYWRLIEPGLHLGYRRLAGRPGSWCVRRYVGSQSYTVAALKGVADDYADADGETVLDFAQAQQAALRHKPQAAGPLTVWQAVEAYLAHLEGRGSTPDARARAEAFILPQLGDVRVEALTTAQIRAWHAGLAKTPPRVRTGKDQRQRYAEFDESDEGKRRRRASANRVLAILRAALNFAFREGRVVSDIEWRRVRPFKGVEAARVRYLTVAEAKRLINACQGEFRRLVQAALATGMRYGELTRLTVKDFNPEAGSVLVYRSKSGKPRHVLLTDEATALFAQWCAGRAGGDCIFRTDRGGIWSTSMQTRPLREACQRAGIADANFHSLRHTWASLAVMNGTPLMVVARNLGHRDTRMCEAHYAHLAPGHVRDAIRSGAPKFGFKPDPTVTPLRR
jgi:integrase